MFTTSLPPLARKVRMLLPGTHRVDQTSCQASNILPASFRRSLDDDIAQIKRLSRLHRYRSWEASFGNLVPAKANLVGMLGRQPFGPESSVLVGNDILRQAVEDPITQTAFAVQKAAGDGAPGLQDDRRLLWRAGSVLL